MQACNVSMPGNFVLDVEGPNGPIYQVLSTSNSAQVLIDTFEAGNYSVVLSSITSSMQKCYIDAIKLGEELNYH